MRNTVSGKRTRHSWTYACALYHPPITPAVTTQHTEHSTRCHRLC